MRASMKKRMILVVFILYIVILCYLLFLSENYGRTDISDEYRYNLVLFREIRRFYDHKDQFAWMFFVNVYGNILAFMPFGFFSSGAVDKNAQSMACCASRVLC